jgi:hypothetical protein
VVLPDEVLLLVVVELVELAGLRALAGLLVWAEQRPLALTRAVAAINSLRAVFMNDVFHLRLVIQRPISFACEKLGHYRPVIETSCREVNVFRESVFSPHLCSRSFVLEREPDHDHDYEQE